MTVYTSTLTSGSLTITADDYVSFLSVKAANTASSFEFTGSAYFQQVLSSSVTLSNGDGVSLTAPSPQSPIQGVTITWLSGSVDIIIGQS